MPNFPFLSPKPGMARRVREFDWSSTPLGKAEGWPAELKMAVAHLLDSRFPGAIVWGPGLTTIYNDAFVPILGNKRNTLGESFAVIWQEAWPEIKPMLEKAYSGESVFIENFHFHVDRLAAPRPGAAPPAAPAPLAQPES